MRNTKKTLTRYLITAGCALAASGLLLWMLDFSSAENLAEKYRILSDAFSLPGVLLTCFFGLLWVSSYGFFDGLRYMFSRVGNMFVPGKIPKHETYYDYKMRKQEKREEKEGEQGSLSFLLFVGLGFILVAVIFVVLYESAYVPTK